MCGWEAGRIRVTVFSGRGKRDTLKDRPPHEPPPRPLEKNEKHKAGTAAGSLPSLPYSPPPPRSTLPPFLSLPFVGLP